MDLNQLRKELEQKNIDISKEKYSQYAGLEYSEDKIEKKSKEKEEISKKALKKLDRNQIPKDLHQSLVMNSIASKLSKIENKIYRIRTEDVKTSVNEKEVTLSNWRTWNSKHLRDYEKREKVFNSLINQSDKLKSLVKKRFDLEKDKLQEYGYSPLGIYLDREEVSKEKLMDLVKSSAEKASVEFQKIKNKISKEAIDKEMEYYDDFYIYRHSIYKPFDNVFEDIDFREKMNQVFRDMEFNLDKINVDAEKREGKTPSPMCIGIQVPNDVRVLYQETTPFGDFKSYCHEMGHALHFASVNGDLKYEDKYIIPAGVAEVFSTLFESLATNPMFLKQELGVEQEKIDELKRRERFMQLYYLTFYGSNAQMKIEYWNKDYSIQEATNRYQEIYQKYVGEEIPGEYWLLHHVMPMYDIYGPSYLLAHVRKSELLEKIKEEYREDWWRSKKAGRYIREKLMGPGAKIPLEEFSRLNEELYLDRIIEK